MSFAIIATGGKQYLVAEGQNLKIEKISGKEGDTVAFETLLITDEKGAKVEIGTPKLSSKVEAKIVKHGVGEKITVVKYKSKIRYHKKTGHKQPFTEVKIGKI